MDENVRMSYTADELRERASELMRDAQVLNEAAALLDKMAAVIRAGEKPSRLKKELKSLVAKHL